MDQPFYPPLSNPSVMYQPSCPPLANSSDMNHPTYPPVTDPSVMNQSYYPPVTNPPVTNQPHYPPVPNPSVAYQPYYPPVTNPSVTSQPYNQPLTNPGSSYVTDQPSYQPLAKPVVVIGPQFCAPSPVDLTIVRKVMTISDGNFTVMDVNGNFVFKIKGKLLSFHDRRVLIDASGNPLFTMKEKILSAHSRYQVFRGESDNSRDVIFSAKQTSMIQFRKKLDVFLANNTREEVCDFKVKGSWTERSCVIYRGESNNIIAQMHKKHTVQSVLLGKDTFSVTVYPNIDYAFIVALILILDAVNEGV